MKKNDILEINNGDFEVIPPESEDHEFMDLMFSTFRDYTGGSNEKLVNLTEKEQSFLMNKAINAAKSSNIFIPQRYL